MKKALAVICLLIIFFNVTTVVAENKSLHLKKKNIMLSLGKASSQSLLPRGLTANYLMNGLLQMRELLL